MSDTPHRCLVGSGANGDSPAKNGGIYIAHALGPDCHANARLIAAAPRLLEFAKAYAELSVAAGGMAPDDATLDEMCRDAIAAAEGS